MYGLIARFIPIANYFLQKEDASSSVNELGLTNVGGIFLVLLVGVIASVAMAAAEKAYDKIRKSRSIVGAVAGNGNGDGNTRRRRNQDSDDDDADEKGEKEKLQC